MLSIFKRYKTNTGKKAKEELDLLSSINKDPENRPIIEPFKKEILLLVEKFGRSGQSGGSAPYTASAISSAVKSLCLHQPIAPITGQKNEWSNTGDEFYQNKRCSALFKKGDKGKAYYLDAIVFTGEEDYDQFTGTVEGVRSRQYVRFPFKPKTFYVDVYRELFDKQKHGENAHISRCEDGDYVYFIKNKDQLNEVFDYYDKKE